MISYNQLRDLVYQSQANSELFKFSDKELRNDKRNHHYLYNNNPFVKNAGNLGKINTNYVINFFDDLAASKNVTFDQLKKNYWNNLREQFSKSVSDSKVYKESLIDTLENKTIYRYFLFVRPLINFIFESQSGRNLYEQNFKEIEKLFYSIYTGKTDLLKELKRNSSIPKDIFKEFIGIEPIEFYEEYFKKSLKIWDGLFKITHIDEFYSRSFDADLSEKDPIIPIDDIYKNNKKDGRKNNLSGRFIIPHQSFWDEANKYYKKHGEDCFSSKKTQNPGSLMIKHMERLMKQGKVWGYEREDVKKEKKVIFKEKKIVILLGNNHDKWVY